MQVTLSKTATTELNAAFRKDKLPKSKRKIARHGTDLYFARLEAMEAALHVESGRVKLQVPATVHHPGAFLLRDHVLRDLLETLRGEKAVDLAAEPEGLRLNGVALTFSDKDFRYFANPADAPSGNTIFHLPE